MNYGDDDDDDNDYDDAVKKLFSSGWFGCLQPVFKLQGFPHLMACTKRDYFYFLQNSKVLKVYYDL